MFQERVISGSHTKIEYSILLENKISVLAGSDLKKKKGDPLYSKHSSKRVLMTLISVEQGCQTHFYPGATSASQLPSKGQM